VLTADLTNHRSVDLRLPQDTYDLSSYKGKVSLPDLDEALHLDRALTFFRSFETRGKRHFI
jgi:hypothetical protein